jgi:hypothetical protein
LRKVQKASGGRFARTIGDAPKKTRVGRWLQKKMYDVDELHSLPPGISAPKTPKKFEGAVHHFTPDDAAWVKGTVNPSATKADRLLDARIGENKWREYQMFNRAAPGSMPETANVGDILRSMGVRKMPKSQKKQLEVLERLQTKLRKKHPEGFVMKELGGAQSGGMFPQETHELGDLLTKYRASGLAKKTKAMETGNLSASEWDKAFKELKATEGYSGRVLEGLMKDSRGAIVQKKIDIEKPRGLRRLPGWLLGQPASKEVRVHVLGGRAVPNLAAPRFDPTMAVFERRKMREAAEYAQGIVNKLPKHQREASFGMDIAPIKGGGFKLIESNPAGYSGLLHPEKNPLMPFKLRKALTGQWSPTVAGAGATAGAVGTGAAAYGATRAAQNVAQPAQGQNMAQPVRRVPQVPPRPAVKMAARSCFYIGADK